MSILETISGGLTSGYNFVSTKAITTVKFINHKIDWLADRNPLANQSLGFKLPVITASLFVNDIASSYVARNFTKLTRNIIAKITVLPLYVQPRSLAIKATDHLSYATAAAAINYFVLRVLKTTNNHLLQATLGLTTLMTLYRNRDEIKARADKFVHASSFDRDGKLHSWMKEPGVPKTGYLINGSDARGYVSGTLQPGYTVDGSDAPGYRGGELQEGYDKEGKDLPGYRNGVRVQS